MKEKEPGLGRKNRKQEYKRERKQERRLNTLTKPAWERIGSFALWVGYRVREEDQEDIVPVRKNASKLELLTIGQRARMLLRREKELSKAKELKELKEKRGRKKRPQQF